MTGDFYSVSQVATKLGLQRHAVLALIRAGELRAVDVSLRPGGRPRWRIAQDDLDGFLVRRMLRKPEQRRRRRRKGAPLVKEYF